MVRQNNCCDEVNKFAKKIKDHLKKNCSKKKCRKKMKKTERIAEIIVNLILLYVFNNLLNWSVPFLTNEYLAVLPILNLSIIATIITNTLFLIYDDRRLYLLARLILDVIGLYFIYSLYLVYPFDFSGYTNGNTIELVVRLGLFVGVIATAIGVAARFIRLIIVLIRDDPDDQTIPGNQRC